ncbi:uncharacterized protein DFL_004248 [Arthrobotrys flagrans]|uniref:Uncharacterized protein n=1 Tax=Arthrobotrys flagrans TaxID=97331 RepID=A0A437A488_ARTFL|nr:hypothetical protein DFL_004248 [Arthrobotrys flagrans]
MGDIQSVSSSSSIHETTPGTSQHITTPPPPMSTQTPSKRSKYANDEERKAAARERQRIYAARKRAEAKNAKLRESQSSIDVDVPLQPELVIVAAPEVVPEAPSPVKKRVSRKSAVGATVTVTATVNAPTTPRKRVSRRKNDEKGEIVGDNAVHVVSAFEDTTDSFKTEDINIDITEDFSVASMVHSFSKPLTVESFIPPTLRPTDTVLIPPQPSPTSQLYSLPVTPYAIFHIPGNPGLVSYYTNYLTALSDHLSNIPGCEFTIFGASLGGFNTSPSPNTPSSFVSLRDQISRQVEIISHLLTTHPSLKIIITGHSLGAYLFLSLLHNFSLHNPALKSRIIGGIGLFPALTHLAKSSSGRTVTPFINIPGVLPFLVVLAKSARDTTLSFLKSPVGVRQALYLGRDELLHIKDDEWDASVWGDESADGNTELVFYYGEKDHWVFDGEREKLIERRGRGGVRWVEKEGSEVVQDRWKPRMIVCEEGVRHSFCVSTEFSELMAEKTARWVEEIVEKDMRGL